MYGKQIFTENQEKQAITETGQIIKSQSLCVYTYIVQELLTTLPLFIWYTPYFITNQMFTVYMHVVGMVCFIKLGVNCYSLILIWLNETCDVENYNYACLMLATVHISL